MSTPTSVYAEMTPNPEVMKFVADRPLIDGPAQAEFTSKAECAGYSSLAEELFNFPFVTGVFISGTFVSVTKDDSLGWEMIAMQMREYIQQWLTEHATAVEEVPPVRTTADIAQVFDIAAQDPRPAGNGQHAVAFDLEEAQGAVARDARQRQVKGGQGRDPFRIPKAFRIAGRGFGADSGDALLIAAPVHGHGQDAEVLFHGVGGPAEDEGVQGNVQTVGQANEDAQPWLGPAFFVGPEGGALDASLFRKVGLGPAPRFAEGPQLRSDAGGIGHLRWRRRRIGPRRACW